MIYHYTIPLFAAILSMSILNIKYVLTSDILFFILVYGEF